jgi:hypothetical protein
VTNVLDIPRTYGNWMLLSNSRAKTFRRCEKQFEFKYVLGLKPKSRALALERGSWLHRLLEVHYDGGDWRAEHKKLSDEFNSLFIEEREELGDLPAECERIMLSYIMNYKDDPDYYRVLDTELDEIITLPNGLKFRMIIDKIVEEPDGGIWIVDYKTVKNFLPPDFMLLDAQLARYFWGAEKFGFKPLRGIIFDEICTKPPTLPEVLKDGSLSLRKNIQCDYMTYYREIKRRGLDVKPYLPHLRYLKAQNHKWFRRTPLAKDRPLVRQQMRELIMTAREMRKAEELGQFPRTPMKDCRWDCSFLEPCTIQLMGGDISDTLKLRYTTRSQRAEDE